MVTATGWTEPTSKCIVNLPRNKKRFLLHFGNDMLFNLLLHICIGGVNIYIIQLQCLLFFPRQATNFFTKPVITNTMTLLQLLRIKAVDRDQWLRSMPMDNVFHFTFNLCIIRSESLQTNRGLVNLLSPRI
jgi:hypothetical protein